MTKRKVNRDVTPTECKWLDEVVERGTCVYEYTGYTYGCVSNSGVAVTLVPNVGPWFELPYSSLEFI